MGSRGQYNGLRRVVHPSVGAGESTLKIGSLFTGLVPHRFSASLSLSTGCVILQDLSTWLVFLTAWWFPNDHSFHMLSVRHVALTYQGKEKKSVCECVYICSRKYSLLERQDSVVYFVPTFNFISCVPLPSSLRFCWTRQRLCRCRGRGHPGFCETRKGSCQQPRAPTQDQCSIHATVCISW